MEVKIYINDVLIPTKDIGNDTITNESVIDRLTEIKSRILRDMKKTA